MPEPIVPPPLRTNEPDPPAPAPTPRQAGTGYLTCDFCECSLTQTGQVYKVSDTARNYRDAGEKHRKEIAKLEEEITALRAQITAKDAELAQLKQDSVAPQRKAATFL